MTSTQNQREWNNAKNWSGPKWMSLYFSKVDTRVVVPKRLRALGWTLNLGHPLGSSMLVLLIVIATLLPLLFAIFMLAPLSR